MENKYVCLDTENLHQLSLSLNQHFANPKRRSQKKTETTTDKQTELKPKQQQTTTTTTTNQNQPKKKTKHKVNNKQTITLSPSTLRLLSECLSNCSLMKEKTSNPSSYLYCIISWKPRLQDVKAHLLILCNFHMKNEIAIQR